MPRRVRMSPVDTAWLRLDPPSCRLAIQGVLVLDQPVSTAALKALLQSRLVAAYPRFSQRAVVDDLGAWWESVPRFALGPHIRRRNLGRREIRAGVRQAEAPAAASVSTSTSTSTSTPASSIQHRCPAPHDPQMALQDALSALATEPLHPHRPLWALDILDGYGTGCVLVFRVHHCVTDGMALMGVMLALTDSLDGHSSGDGPTRGTTRGTTDATTRGTTGATSRGTTDGPPMPEHGGAPGPDPADPSPIHDPWTALLDPLTQPELDALEAAREIRTRYERIAADPQATRRLNLQGAALAAEALRLLLMTPDTPTRYKAAAVAHQADQARGVARPPPKRVAWAPPLDLGEVRALSRALGCSVHDVLLTCASMALRRHLLAQGETVQGVEIRALVPVNLRRRRELSALGNRFGLVPVMLPLHEAHPLKCLALLQRRMGSLKNSLLPPLSLGLMGAVGRAPAAVQQAARDLLSAKATAVLTHVPGPSSARRLAGVQIRQILFWVPQSGEVGLGLSMLSYAGQVQFAIKADAALLPDPQAIAEAFRSAFEDLLYGVLMLA